MFIARGVRSSLQRELDAFYKEVTGADFNIRTVTKGAFTQARSKLKPEAFLALNDCVTDTFYNEAPYLVWKQMRLLAVDGTRIALPNHPSVVEEFGQHQMGRNADYPKSLALGSMLYDPVNLLVLDGRIAPYSSSERDLLYQHMGKIHSGDLLLLDRYYPSQALMYELAGRQVHFCMRMKKDGWLTVKEFTESEASDAIVEFELPQKDKHLLEKYPALAEQPLKCRLVKILLPTGEVEILCTSLIDDQEVTIDDLAELYHYRWQEEEAFKLLKSRMELENFSGKTAKAVKQDYFAKIFMMSLSANLAFPIEEKVRKEYKQSESRKHAQKINRTSAQAQTRHAIIPIFIKELSGVTLTLFDQIVYKTREIIRPGRKHERKHRPKRPYYMNYKGL